MLTDLQQAAIDAAFPFGGAAQPEMRYVIDELVENGLVEICCTDHEGVIGYALTAAGKAARNTN